MREYSVEAFHDALRYPLRLSFRLWLQDNCVIRNWCVKLV